MKPIPRIPFIPMARRRAGVLDYRPRQPMPHLGDFAFLWVSCAWSVAALVALVGAMLALEMASLFFMELVWEHYVEWKAFPVLCAGGTTCIVFTVLTRLLGRKFKAMEQREARREMGGDN